LNALFVDVGDPILILLLESLPIGFVPAYSTLAPARGVALRLLPRMLYLRSSDSEGEVTGVFAPRDSSLNGSDFAADGQDVLLATQMAEQLVLSRISLFVVGLFDLLKWELTRDIIHRWLAFLHHTG